MEQSICQFVDLMSWEAIVPYDCNASTFSVSIENTMWRSRARIPQSDVLEGVALISVLAPRECIRVSGTHCLYTTQFMVNTNIPV